MGLGRQRSGAVDPELAHVRALAVALVAATGLAERVLGAGNVEYVVNDLKQDAQLRSESAESNCRRFLDVADCQYAHHRGRNQTARLELVQAPQSLDTVGRGSFDVRVLAADHALDPGCHGQLGRRPQNPLGWRALVQQQMGEALGIEPVARQDRDILAKCHMARRPSTAQIVIVHRGQVIVDQ